MHIRPPKRRTDMKMTDALTVKRTFLDIPNAAELAGFSVRHFRRIIEEEQIRIVQIGRKFFILGADFERWQATKKVKPSSHISINLVDELTKCGRRPIASAK